MTAPSRPSNCSPFSPYRQCSSGVIFGSSTAGHSFLDIACRGKGGFVQQGSWHLRDPNRKTPLSGPKLVGYGAHLAPRHHCKTPLSGPKLVDSGAHTRIAKPFYPVRNWWHHRKTPLSGPKLVDSGVHTASQNPFMRSIAKPLCQDRILPLGHYNDLILGKVKTSERPCKRFRVTVSKPEARFGVAACPKANLP